MSHRRGLLGVCLVGVVMVLGACAAKPGPAAVEQQFQQRRDFYIRNLAAQDPAAITAWGRNINLGDPHKYALPPIVARLALDPADAKAIQAYRELMEVDKTKGDRGLYHFAAYLRARIYFQFKDRLPADIVESNLHDVRNHFSQLRSGGTENHTWMHRATGYLWAEKLGGADPKSPYHEHYLALRQWLIEQTRRLYTVGQGEYDSSTYVAFSVSALSNIYDFSDDPVMRDWAQAAMDFFAAVQAIKYFHGCNMGPEARGFADQAVGARPGAVKGAGKQGLTFAKQGAITDWMNWLWYGGSVAPMPLDRSDVQVDEHARICLALSAYRPAAPIRHLALKNLALPFHARGSKPSYYGTPVNKDNKDQETLYVARHFAMTSLHSGEDGVATTGTILPQTTMFKLTLLDTDDVRVFGLSQGYHKHYPLEGRGPFDQFHQHGPAAIHIAAVTDLDTIRRRTEKMPLANIQPRAILGVPRDIPEPIVRDGWYFWHVNQAFVAARPLNGKAAFEELPERAGKTDLHRWLVSPGELSGWVVQAGEQPQFADLAAFQQAVLASCKLDTSSFASHRAVTFTTLAGDELRMRHTGALGGKPEASTNGQPLRYEGWPVFDGPYLSEPVGSGVLRVTDGAQTLTINVNGDRPTFELK